MPFSRRHSTRKQGASRMPKRLALVAFLGHGVRLGWDDDRDHPATEGRATVAAMVVARKILIPIFGAVVALHRVASRRVKRLALFRLVLSRHGTWTEGGRRIG